MNGTNKAWRDFLPFDKLRAGCSFLQFNYKDNLLAKSMTGRSPDDSAGEHNKGSRWTASLLTEGGSNETECSGMSLA